jgi:hypothetical protein
VIAQEADFYGSMDGASKFVRGDAIAGIVILLINVLGGLVVGVLQHDMGIAAAAKNYTLLTIGDGLVAQIPALVISTAAGLVVSRVSTDQDMGQQMTGQLFAKPQARIYLLSPLLVRSSGDLNLQEEHKTVQAKAPCARDVQGGVGTSCCSRAATLELHQLECPWGGGGGGGGEGGGGGSRDVRSDEHISC